jgi:hypothetical protein
MDSLPTTATQPLLSMLVAALSSVIFLFLADAIGRVRLRKASVRPAGGSSVGMGGERRVQRRSINR